MKTTDFFTGLPSVLPQGFLRERIKNLLQHGGLPKGYLTGLHELDRICRLDLGRLLVVTGIPGHGKSEYVDFLTTTFNKKYGLKTAYFSPENFPPELHLEKIIRKFTCKPLEELTDEERERALTYVLNNFYFFNCYDITRLSEIMATAETTVTENSVSILVIDPYNRIDVEASATDIETQYISRILDELSRFAVKHNILVILVAHPRKMEANGNGFRIPNAYDIAASANFYNKADFVQVVHRARTDDTLTTIKVDKVKFSNYGTPGKCELEYDAPSGNYYVTSLPFDDNYDYEEDTTPKPFVFPATDPVKSPLDVMVSMYPGVTDTTSKEVISLKDFLMTDKYKDVATLIRSGRSPEERHDIKVNNKVNLPCVTPSGLFSERSGKNLTQHSGLLCIDIDLHDNPGGVMDNVPSLLASLPYVAYASKSITGDGYFAIVPLEHPTHHLEHYLAIEKEFKDEYGIVLDKQCKDVCRLRFATYDENPYYNPNAMPYYKEYSEPTVTKDEKTFTTTTSFVPRSSQDTEYDITASVADLDKKIEEVKQKGIVVADDYPSWHRLAMSLTTLGEEGRERFHVISSTSTKYNKAECDQFYTDTCERYKDNNKYTLRTAHKILNDAMKTHV